MTGEAKPSVPMVLSVHREGAWRHLPIECMPPPVRGEEGEGDESEGLKKWWKREVKRLRASYALVDEALIIRSPADVRLDAWGSP